jgi:hypothetical protein
VFNDAVRLTNQQPKRSKILSRPTPPWPNIFVMQERTMARYRPTLHAEDAKALTLLMSHAADEFAIALDRCGWMIVQQPQFGDRRWFMNYPSDACPEWADNDVPEQPPSVPATLAGHGRRQGGR